MIAITGAGGRFGRELVRHFTAKGVPLRVIGLTDRPWFDGHDKVVGDLFHEAVRRRAMAGAQAVIHLAEARPNRAWVSRIGPVGYDKQMFHVNLGMTRLVAEAARDAGVERFIYAGSESVYGPPPRQCPCTEETPPEPNGPYGRSKLEAELLLQDMHRRGDLEVVILRFSVILGHFASNQPVVNRLFSMAAKNLPIPMAQSGSTLKHVVFSRDAVDIVERSLARPQAPGRIYNVAGAGAATVSDIFAAVTDVLDSHSPAILLHRAVLPALNTISGWLGNPFLLPEFARSAYEHTCFSTGRALAELGFRPKFDTVQAFVEAARWFRDNPQ